MSESDAAYQQGYDRGFLRGREYERERLKLPAISKWIISHPGDGEPITCASFEEAMEKWFEGFNIPVLVVDGNTESFKVSYQRVQDYFESKRKP